jgi:hypothetical protein
MALNFNEKRNFVSRKKGIYTKLTKIAELFGTQMYIIIRYKSKDYAFSTSRDASWPPNFDEVVSLKKVMANVDTNLKAEIFSNRAIGPL